MTATPINPDELRADIQRLTDKIDRLERRYCGVRPSWVSADIAIMKTARDGAQRLLEEAS